MTDMRCNACGRVVEAGKSYGYACPTANRCSFAPLESPGAANAGNDWLVNPPGKRPANASYLDEIARLTGEIAKVTAERDEALDQVEELERHQEVIAAEFEGDLWVGVRKLLDETGFDWSGEAQDNGVSAADACEHLAETLRCMDDAEKRLRTRAEAAETALATMTAERDEARLAARQFFEQNNALQDLLATSPVGMAFDNLATARAEGVAEGLRRAQLAAQQALIDAAHEYGSQPALKFSSAMFQAETIASNAILALIPAPAKPADGPRRASGPIDPESGFATTGAEARWIADTDAGVYDDDTGDIGRSIANTFAPPASDEGGEG